MWQPEAKKMAKYADVIWDAQCQVIVILELSHRDIYLPINWGKGKRRGWRREGKVCVLRRRVEKEFWNILIFLHANTVNPQN